MLQSCVLHLLDSDICGFQLGEKKETARNGQGSGGPLHATAKRGTELWDMADHT